MQYFGVEEFYDSSSKQGSDCNWRLWICRLCQVCRNGMKLLQSLSSPVLESSPAPPAVMTSNAFGLGFFQKLLFSVCSQRLRVQLQR